MHKKHQDDFSVILQAAFCIPTTCAQAAEKREEQRENRKDDRIKQEGTQQSKMIQQRQTDSPAIDFEAESGLDMSPFM